MTQNVTAKICGLSEFTHAALAAESGAGLLGFVHFPKSPRHIAPENVSPIADAIREQYPHIGLVAVTVNATDDEILAIMQGYDPDFIQLHGSEIPERAQELRDRYQIGVIKAIPVATAEDFAQATDFADSADMLLIDAKPTPDATLPGGNGRPFDWALLKNATLPDLPVLLSGGLTPENLAQAIAQTGAEWVDVSSGVEYQPGKKDPARIRAFFEALPK